ncbi:metallophosphatase family protein [bacterium]|nr:metallophosphatase family protein [bacterium]MDB4607453.1 metallophosphatase family protein [bacterium]MDC0304527.1 metallophosphatase family protein [Akkermansiaceae bacterium]
MKIFVFSDIHGNSYVLEELKRAWEALKPDLKIFLGDIYGYYYGQEEILDFFQSNDVICLLGNHDSMALSLLDKDLNLEEIANKYGKSYEHILKTSGDHTSWLRSISSSLRMNLGSYDCLFVHGDHNDNLDGRIYPDTPLVSNSQDWDVLFCGHTHIPFIKKSDDKLIVNVGSIGQPRHGGLANAVLFNPNTGALEFLNFNWHPERVRKDLESRGDSYLAHTKILDRKIF